MSYSASRTFFVVLLASLSCNRTVETVLPVRQNITLSVYASGKVLSKNQYEVKPNANGTIQEVYVKEGDRVEAGSVLFSLRNETAELNREIASLSKAFADRQNNVEKIRDLDARIDLARIRLNHDSLMVERQTRLKKQGIGTELELEQRELAFQQTKTELSGLLLQREMLVRELAHNETTAEKNFEIADAAASDLRVKSDINGKVYALFIETGELVTSQTPVAVLGDEDEFMLELLVDEYDISQIQEGQEVKVSLDSYREQVFDARVSKIHPMMDSGNKSFVVEATFINRPPTLYPNLSLEANIIIEVKENALLVPSAFVFKENHVITSEGDTLTVQTGIKNYNHTEIIHGIDDTTELIKP
jgi:multidrug efflux pump subunit AcrA (membrane-fusion protein)